MVLGKVALSAEMPATPLPPPAAAKIEFERDIRPIFEANCLRCHGPQTEKSHFRLDLPAAALAGGDENTNDIVPGHSAQSWLIRYVARQVPDLEMPPPDRGNPLTPEQKIEFAKKFFPDVEFRLSKTVFTAALEMASEGVDEGVMIVGEDRFAAFTTLLTTYAGTEALGLKTTEVKAIARAASDASASCARSAALAGDWETFRDLSPTDDVGLSHQLYAAVRNGLGVA